MLKRLAPTVVLAAAVLLVHGWATCTGATSLRSESWRPSRLSFRLPARYTLWQVAWEDFASHFFGSEPTSTRRHTFQAREWDVGYDRQPHSLPLEVLSERVVGGVVFFGFPIICLSVGGS